MPGTALPFPASLEDEDGEEDETAEIQRFKGLSGAILGEDLSRTVPNFENMERLLYRTVNLVFLVLTRDALIEPREEGSEK